MARTDRPRRCALAGPYLGGVLLAAGLILAGCVAPPQSMPEQATPDQAPPDQATSQHAQPETGKPETGQPTIARAVPAPQPPPPPPDIDGMAADTLRQLLGPPNFIRRDRPAQLWRFRAEACVLDVFLYPRGSIGAVGGAKGGPKGGAYIVRHAEARAAQGGPMMRGDCVARLLQRQAGTSVN